MLYQNVVMHVAGKKLIIQFSCIICALNFWTENYGEMSYTQIIMVIKPLTGFNRTKVVEVKMGFLNFLLVSKVK